MAVATVVLTERRRVGHAGPANLQGAANGDEQHNIDEQRNLALRLSLGVELRELTPHLNQLLQPDPLTLAIQAWHRGCEEILRDRTVEVIDNAVLQNFIRLALDALVDPLSRRMVDYNTNHVAARALLNWLRAQERRLQSVLLPPAPLEAADAAELAALIAENEAMEDNIADDAEAFIARAFADQRRRREEDQAAFQANLDAMQQRSFQRIDQLSNERQRQSAALQGRIDALEQRLQNLQTEQNQVGGQLDQQLNRLRAIEIETIRIEQRIHQIEQAIQNQKSGWLQSLATTAALVAACWAATALLPAGAGAAPAFSKGTSMLKVFATTM